MAESRNSSSDDEEIQREIDFLVRTELEKTCYRDLVNGKFRDFNSRIDNEFHTMNSETQSMFNDSSAHLERLEKEQRELTREMYSLLSSDGDVIVLDDDDPEPPEKEAKIAGSSRPTAEQTRKLQKIKSETVVPKSILTEPDPRLKPDKHGLYLGLRVLAKRRSEWFPANIIDILTVDGDKKKYKVQYEFNRAKTKLTANHLADIETDKRYSPNRIGAGSRIAANFKNDGIYSGVIAEAADKKTNRGRPLVFFDDGYAMYCTFDSVYLVYEQLERVWEDISIKNTADYIKEYLSVVERPMLSVKVNQVLKVEFRGEWHKARCVRVDSSLAEMMYLSDNSREWIFRGSLRLEPLYKQSQNKMKSMHNKPQKKIARAHTGVRKAHIEYATIDLTRDSSPSPSSSPTREDRKKNVGKKSTGGVPKPQPYLEGSQSNHLRPSTAWKAPWDRSNFGNKVSVRNSHVTQLPQSFSEFRGGVDIASKILSKENRENEITKKRDNKLDSNAVGSKEVKAYIKSDNHRSKINSSFQYEEIFRSSSRISAIYTEHICTRKCIDQFGLTHLVKNINPLMKPLLYGWTRELAKKRGDSPACHIYYRTPCGRMCRSMDDVDRYMLETNNLDLDYDEFCFDPSVRTHCNTDVHPHKAKFFMDDYSEGKENIPISCVNEINAERPPKIPYTKDRIPGIGVKIETSQEFMVCCNCPDNCRDRSKCPCQQLTVSATSCRKRGKVKPGAGYNYKRLNSFLPTGIYECNKGCSCNKLCSNRVVQKGLHCRLQMFKTHKKGWGIRCLDDIAKGTFVCIYTGKIQTEEQADEEGLENGDEYLAELDYIEVAERLKDVDDGGSSTGIDSDMDDDEQEKREQEIMRNRRVDLSDSGNNTTDSELEDDERGKVGDRNSENSGDAKRDHAGNHKIYGKWKSSNSYLPMPSVLRHGLSPPRSDDETTDTDTDYSNEDSRSPSGPSSRNHNRTSSQGLHSSRISNYDKLDSDDDDVDADVNQTRKYFGCPDTFIIDAKQTGNLGRYLNHSCSPNLLVQNVFIDTHDLRFPWVAFFANSNIRARNELTWDYNYEIGSVEGREIQCYCGAYKCRKRLL